MRLRRCVIGTLCVFALTFARPGSAGAVVVLDGQSVWRSFPVLKPPVVEFDTGITPLLSGKPWLDRETPAAPAGWTGPGFSDASWMRGTVQAHPDTPYLANLCLRARFEVTDPAAVKDLKLSLAYYGGVIVYVNGREIARGSLPQGARAPETLAEGDPVEAYLTEAGDVVPGGWQAARHTKALAARERKLADIPVPASVLRAGVNILAVETIRSPYNKILAEPKHRSGSSALRGAGAPFNLTWKPCEVRAVGLSAASSDGLVPNAGRPEGLQAWNGNLLDNDAASDYGDRCEPLRAVALKGPRNGWSSGKVVLGSAKAIEGLKVTCGELKQGTSVVPASAMRARYGVLYGNRMDVLLEAPLESFPAAREGCVVPVWLTVKVPRDAKPGTYTGQVKVEVTGERPLTVPVTLEVADWAVPDTQDYRTWMELMQSPDTLAAYYGVALWSAEHWRVMGESFRYMGEIGSRVVHIPLIAETNSGNSESMVRWVKNADGTVAHDFSIMDRYLDLAVAKMGKPKMVVFTAWERYLQPPPDEVVISETDPSHIKTEKGWAIARWNQRDKGPAVTALDRTSGETETVFLPKYEDPAAKGLWKPLFDELHRKMAARGLEDTMCLGMGSDYWPSKAEVTVLQEITGDLPWILHTHGGNRVGVKMQGIAPVAYVAYVWNVEYAKDTGESRLGWKRPELYAEFRRFGSLNTWPASTIMLFPELQITGIQRGLGRVGADFWPVVKDRQGQPRGWLWAQYPQSLWHSCNLSSHMLVPGPDGPVASVRYEQMREGVQQCEARIAIEAALTDDALKTKLGPELAARCQALLEDRGLDMLKAFSTLQLTSRDYAMSSNNWYLGCGGGPGHLWYAGSGWQDRAQELYGLAGEVERKLAGK